MTQKINPLLMLGLELRASLSEFTQVMFRSYMMQPFVMSWHHLAIMKALEMVADGKIKKLMINMPPRHTKTELCVKMFTSWGFALNPRAKFMHLSYSDTLVKNNSEAIKSVMELPLYNQLYPSSSLRSLKQSNTEWYTSAGGGMYATSTQGQVTGFGAGRVDDETVRYVNPQEWSAAADFLDAFEDTGQVFNGALIIDDPIKPEDGESPIKREAVNNRYDSTIRNRVNSRNTPIVLIMQRVHENDLCGYLLKTEPGEWTQLTLPAIIEDTSQILPMVQDLVPEFHDRLALWPFKMTLEELDDSRKKNAYVFETQYMQDPKPREGLLYEEFNTYTELPTHLPLMHIWNYTDPADTGKDNLDSISFKIFRGDANIYVVDVVHTADKAELTEPRVVSMLDRNMVTRALFEANGGGRLYARNIERDLRASQNHTTRIQTFHQSENKMARIQNNAPRVNNLVKFPHDWKDRWPIFHNDLTSYRKNAKPSDEDGAPDALTGCYEMVYSSNQRKAPRRVN